MNLLSHPGVRLQARPPAPADFGKIFLFGSAARSPSPECPSFEHMERKQKKPLMEKKRRARINACFDRLKELLLHSELQQNSKMEKADILENTVQFVTLLQQKNARLQQQLQQMLGCTDNGTAFQQGLREGVSLSVTATVDLLAGLPPPFSSPELCHRVQVEVPEKVGQATAAFGISPLRLRPMQPFSAGPSQPRPTAPQLGPALGPVQLLRQQIPFASLCLPFLVPHFQQQQQLIPSNGKQQMQDYSPAGGGGKGVGSQEDSFAQPAGDNHNPPVPLSSSTAESNAAEEKGDQQQQMEELIDVEGEDGTEKLLKRTAIEEEQSDGEDRSEGARLAMRRSRASRRAQRVWKPYALGQ